MNFRLYRIGGVQYSTFNTGEEGSRINRDLVPEL